MTNYNYQLNPAQATDLAQEIHDYIDDGGEIREEAIVDRICEEALEDLRAWLEDNIDWDGIRRADEEAAEDYRETCRDIRAMQYNPQLRGWAG